MGMGPVLIADHLSQWDAAIAAWLPGTEGQGVSDVLFGDYPFVGRLPFTWPRAMEDIPVERTLQSERGVLFPFGHGLSAEDPARAGTGPDR